MSEANATAVPTPSVPPTSPSIVSLGSIARRYPNAAIVANPSLERWIINWVWATVPAQYYILTTLSGGMRGNQWLAVVVAVVSCMLLVLLVSFLLALLSVKMDTSFELRLRAWSVSLVTQWAATVTLLTASYLSAAGFGSNLDLIQIAVCKAMACPNHPSLLAGSSFVIYLLYSLAAVLLVFAVLKLTRCDSGKTDAPAPHTVVVVLICTVLLDLLYSASKWT